MQVSELISLPSLCRRLYPYVQNEIHKLKHRQISPSNGSRCFSCSRSDSRRKDSSRKEFDTIIDRSMKVLYSKLHPDIYYRLPEIMQCNASSLQQLQEYVDDCRARKDGRVRPVPQYASRPFTFHILRRLRNCSLERKEESGHTNKETYAENEVQEQVDTVHISLPSPDVLVTPMQRLRMASIKAATPNNTVLHSLKTVMDALMIDAPIILEKHLDRCESGANRNYASLFELTSSGDAHLHESDKDKSEYDRISSSISIVRSALRMRRNINVTFRERGKAKSDIDETENMKITREKMLRRLALLQCLASVADNFASKTASDTKQIPSLIGGIDIVFSDWWCGIDNDGKIWIDFRRLFPEDKDSDDLEILRRALLRNLQTFDFMKAKELATLSKNRQNNARSVARIFNVAAVVMDESNISCEEFDNFLCRIHSHCDNKDLDLCYGTDSCESTSPVPLTIIVENKEDPSKINTNCALDAGGLKALAIDCKETPKDIFEFFKSRHYKENIKCKALASHRAQQEDRERCER